MENERRKIILETKIQENQQNKILNPLNAIENAKINEELAQYKSKFSSLQKTIEYYKMKLSEAIYAHDNSKSYEDYKKLLTSQNEELSKLKSEINILEARLLNIEYPQLSSKVDLANLESELKHREIEISTYLKEKEQIRNSVESFRNTYHAVVSPKSSIMSPASPSKYSYQYLASSDIPSSSNENAYGSYKNLSALEKNVNEKREELKAMCYFKKLQRMM